MKYLGLDLGTKTLGLALSDKMGIISSPYKVIHYTDIDALVQEVKTLVADLQIDKLILGYPKNMNNSCGFAAERSLDFKKRLEMVIDKPIILVDERLSTVEATNILISGDVRREKRKKVVDGLAASIILDTYLRKIEKEGKENGKE